MKMYSFGEYWQVKDVDEKGIISNNNIISGKETFNVFHNALIVMQSSKKISSSLSPLHHQLSTTTSQHLYHLLNDVSFPL